MRPFLILITCMVGFAGSTLAQTAFVPGFEDLPLAPTLTVQEDPVAFVTAAGRIIEATAKLNGTAQAVSGFYDTTLPQLGWSKGPGRTYVRDGETLSLDMRTEAGAEYIVFRLTPDGSR